MRRFAVFVIAVAAGFSRLTGGKEVSTLVAPATILFHTDGAWLIPDRRMSVVPWAGRL